MFCRGFAAWQHPRLRSVLWLAWRGSSCGAILAKNLPHRSREHEFTDGRVGRFRPVKDRFVLKRVYGLRRVLTTGSDEFPDSPNGVTEWHSGSVQRLGSCRFLRASRLAPLIPLRRETLRPRNIPRLWTRERAGEENRAFFQVFRNPFPLA